MVDVKYSFVKADHFKKIKQTLFSSNINWYWSHAMVTDDSYNKTTSEDSGFWYHNFYFRGEVLSPFFDTFILPILEPLKISELYNVRANCMYNPIGSKKVISDWHVDLKDSNATTAILYLNTCNGCTEIKKDIIYTQESVENTFISFNSMLNHRAIGQTDSLRRIVINFNYYV